jgi:hypothetical protein
MGWAAAISDAAVVTSITRHPQVTAILDEMTALRPSFRRGGMSRLTERSLLKLIVAFAGSAAQTMTNWAAARHRPETPIGEIECPKR